LIETAAVIILSLQADANDAPAGLSGWGIVPSPSSTLTLSWSKHFQ